MDRDTKADVERGMSVVEVFAADLSGTPLGTGSASV
jgi:hypothetical protein